MPLCSSRQEASTSGVAAVKRHREEGGRRRRRSKPPLRSAREASHREVSGRRARAAGSALILSDARHKSFDEGYDETRMMRLS